MRNLHELSCNPSPYILLVIPRPLLSEIEEGEHYIIANLLNLASSSSSPAHTSMTKVVGRELAISLRSEQPSLVREDSDPAPNHLRRLIGVAVSRVFLLQKKDSRPTPQASKKGRRVPERRRALGTGVEDFVSWVAPISTRPLASEEEEEEEEDEMADLIHNFGTQKHKWGASFKRATMLPPRWLVRLINIQPARVRMGRR